MQLILIEIVTIFKKLLELLKTKILGIKKQKVKKTCLKENYCNNSGINLEPSKHGINTKKTFGSFPTYQQTENNEKQNLPLLLVLHMQPASKSFNIYKLLE